MSDRDLTSAVQTALEDYITRVGICVEMVFDDGAVRLWSGIGPLAFDGKTFQGIGQLGGIDKVEESADDVKAAGIVFSLSGIPTDKISLCLNEHFQGRPVTAWMVFFDADWQLIPNAITVFKGRMDYPVIDEGGETATVSVFAESVLVDLERPRVRRYTDADQQALYPGDRGLEFVASIQNVDIIWKSAR